MGRHVDVPELCLHLPAVAVVFFSPHFQPAKYFRIVHLSYHLALRRVVVEYNGFRIEKVLNMVLMFGCY